MNLLSLAILATGGVLIYSAIKGYDPRELVKAAITGSDMPEVKYEIGDNGFGLPGLPDIGGDDGLIPDFGWQDLPNILPIDNPNV